MASSASSPDAVAAGIDGLIIVDLPPEEDDELCLPALARASISSAWPRRPPTPSRLPAVLANTSGFLYYVSITGITGTAAPDFGGSRRRWAASSATPTCPWRSASASRRRPGRGDRGGRRRGGGGLGAGRRAGRDTSIRAARRRPDNVAVVTGLVQNCRRRALGQKRRRRRAARRRGPVGSRAATSDGMPAEPDIKRLPADRGRC